MSSPVNATPPIVDGTWRSVPKSEVTPQPHGYIKKTIPSVKCAHLIPSPSLDSSSSTMERSSTIFAVSSHFYDNPQNRGRYHRAGERPAMSNILLQLFAYNSLSVDNHRR